MGHSSLEENMLDSDGLHRIGSAQLLLGWTLARHSWAGWNVEEVNFSRTNLKDEYAYRSEADWCFVAEKRGDSHKE
jgi:hypothetical protein